MPKPKKSSPADPVYLNFVRQEYKRRILAHRASDEPFREEDGEQSSDTKRLFGYMLTHKLMVFPIFVVGMLLAVFFAQQLVSVIAYTVLLALASFSTVYKRKIGLPLGGVELVTFGTVLTGIAFNPLAGIIFGVVSSLASEIISANIGPLTWIYIVNMAAVGFLAGIFSGLPLTVVGMAATALILLINQAVYFVIGDEEIKTMTAVYMVTNVIFNFLLFVLIGGRIFALLN